MAIFWGKAGKRFGARPTMTLAFFAMRDALFAAGAVGDAAPLLTGGCLLCGAFFTIALDALGSTVFMRSVRSYERPQMAAVYRTYLDFSELTPPLVYSVVLAFFGLGSVFVTLGCLTGGLRHRHVALSAEIDVRRPRYASMAACCAHPLVKAVQVVFLGHQHARR